MRRVAWASIVAASLSTVPALQAAETSRPEWETTDKLRYAPPTLVAPTVVDAGVGYLKVELAADEDAIIRLPKDRPRVKKLATSGGRHVRIIGGDLGSSDLQPAGMTGSLFLEGLAFDFARGLPEINGKPVDADGKQIHDAIHVVGVKPGTPEPPNVFVQNCHIAGLHGTNRAYGTPVEIKSIRATGKGFDIETVAPHGLAADQNFGCGPTSEEQLDRRYRVLEVVSPTQVRAALRAKDRPSPSEGTTATGGLLWPELAKVGKHADAYQTNDSTIQGVVHFYKVTMDVGYQAFIGGHSAGDRQARGLDMCRVNIRANDVYPRDDRSMFLYFGDTDQGGSTDPNRGRKQPFPVSFDRVYIKPRPGLSLTSVIYPGPGTTRAGVPVGAVAADDGKTATWPAALGVTGQVTLSEDGFGEDGKDYADLTGPNPPGLDYESPGYSSDAVQPLKLKQIVAPESIAVAAEAKPGDAIARLDVEFTGAGHVIYLKLTDDAGGRFALKGRDLIRLRAGKVDAAKVTVRASEAGDESNAISRTLMIGAQ